MLWICFALGVSFWFLRIAVCYHDSRSMLPIAFDAFENHENIDIFVICSDLFSCVLASVSCFFCNKTFYFGLLVLLYHTGTLAEY